MKVEWLKTTPWGNEGETVEYKAKDTKSWFLCILVGADLSGTANIDWFDVSPEQSDEIATYYDWDMNPGGMSSVRFFENVVHSIEEYGF